MSDGVVQTEIADMRGRGALPRDNGELVFAAPWEGRALAMAIAVVQALGLTWDEFRLHLIGRLAGNSACTYYENWLAALEDLLVEQGPVSAAELTALNSSEADSG
jgi:nitrile hydratase accessory protein